jgi:hypothetical protein
MMRRGTTLIALAALGVAGAVSACSSDGSGTGTLNGGNEPGPSTEAPIQVGVGGTPATVTGGGSTPGTGGTSGSDGHDPNLQNNPNIQLRQIDYGEALRTASMKLGGELPTLADVNAIASAGSQAAQKTLYEAKIDAMLADPRFASTQIQWWRNTFKTGGAGDPMNGVPSFDTAATFAAMVVTSDRPYTDLFTASSGTCPTYASGAFAAAECGNGAPVAGLLTDPGLMAQFFSNMAFRRVRFVQETFACAKFPAEYSSKPVPMGVSIYTSPWDFNSISGGPGSKVNFHDTSAIVCANCHTTINHMAPLFSFFDDKGQYTAGKIQVMTPVVPPVTSVRTDWLPASEGYAWRNGVAVTDLPTLGQAMAKDPDVATCAVNRIWDWAFSRGDIVNDIATIPPIVTQPLVADFTSNGMKLKRVIRNVFTSDDFVRF